MFFSHPQSHPGDGKEGAPSRLPTNLLQTTMGWSKDVCRFSHFRIQPRHASFLVYQVLQLSLGFPRIAIASILKHIKLKIMFLTSVKSAWGEGMIGWKLV